MALKLDRSIIETDATKTCTTVAEAGVGVVNKTAGSGVALGGSAGQVELIANPSGKKIAGILLQDVVSLDLTRYKTNQWKDEINVDEHCVILRKGFVSTNKIVSGQTPTENAIAYLAANGEFTPTVSSTGGVVATPKVGEFRGIKDADGYVKIEVNLPFIGS